MISYFSAKIDDSDFLCKLFRLFLNNKLDYLFLIYRNDFLILIKYISFYTLSIQKYYICIMLKQKIERFINDKELFDINDKLVVALSGGADSVALLRILLSLGYDCVAAHCNFHLRGDESDRDEAFVRDLCTRVSVPLEVVHFQTADYAKSNGLSIEMAARELRYSWFDNIRQKHGAAHIAVAHHKDDSVETFLLNLSRGTGINGLKGIMPKNGFIVRPLLEIDRDDILDYLNGIGQSYVTDSTNLENVYTRNKIRLDIIPLFKQINPSFCDSVSETASRLADVAAIYKSAILSSMERVMISSHSLSIEKLLNEVAPQAILFEWLSPFGFNASQIKDIERSLKSTSGKMFYSNNWTLLRDRDCLFLKEKVADESTYKLNVRTFNVDPGFIVPKCRERAYLDAGKLRGELNLRKWQSGDKFVPYGMKGFKKVRDYLRDRKFSLFEKENVMVVTSGSEIVWLVNERTDNRFCVDAETKIVIEVSVLSES